MLPVRSFFTLSTVLLATCLVSGCGANFARNEPGAGTASVINGVARGGNQTIGKAAIYLYAAGTGGYGTAARSMLTAPGYTLSDDSGRFTITGSYTCQPGDQVYLLATGGNPGLASGTNNSALALMAALGPCSSLQPTTFIVVDEVTTVAAAYALSGFMSTATNLSSSGTPAALTGLANAMRTAGSMASYNTGTSFTLTPGGNGTVPTGEINSLANLLVPCVNSNGATGACSSLFTATTPAGGTAPTDTVQAMLNIAHNPGLNVSTLFTQSLAVTPFQPTLTAAPHDWTVALSYTGGGLTAPSVLAVDGLGHIWATDNSHAVVELGADGSPYSPATGYTGGALNGIVATLAIDSTSHAWVSVVTTSGTQIVGRIAVLGSGGSAINGAAGYTGGGLFGAQAVAFDPFGNFWAAGAETVTSGYVVHLSKFAPDGTPLSPSAGFAASGIGASLYLASDASGNIWSANYAQSNPTGVGFLSKTANDGLSGTDFQNVGGLNGPGYVAIDSTGNVWAPNNNTGTVTELAASGSAISPSTGYTGLPSGTTAVAIDGTGRVWTLDNTATTGAVYSLGELNSSGTVLSPAGGFQNSTLYNPVDMAIDGSGNIWLTNYSTSHPALVQFVGLAAPVVTPRALAVATGRLAVRP